MPFAESAPLPLGPMLAVIAVLAAIFATPFSAALHELRPRQTVPAVMRVGRRIRRSGSLDLLAFPLVGPLSGAFSSQGEERRIWLARFWVQALVMTGVPLLFWWECSATGSGASLNDCVGRFLVHTVFFLFLLAASTVDWLDMVASDALTVCAAEIGVILLTLFAMALPQFHSLGVGLQTVEFFSPGRAPGWIESPIGLGIACLCLGLWFLAVLHRSRWPVSGLRGFRLRVCSMVRRAKRWDMLMSATVASAAIALVWMNGGPAWRGMLSAIIGTALGVAIGWSTRIIFSTLFRREALGFGDVLFLGTIGAYLGWQGAVLAFLLFPFCAAPFLFVQHLAGRMPERQAAMPYLSLAAVVTCIGWSVVWPRLLPFLSLFV